MGHSRDYERERDVGEEESMWEGRENYEEKRKQGVGGREDWRKVVGGRNEEGGRRGVVEASPPCNTPRLSAQLLS